MTDILGFLIGMAIGILVCALVEWVWPPNTDQ